MKWLEPRNVDEFVWLDCEEWDGPRILRYGRVSWMRENPDYYYVDITYQSESGLGLGCWPVYRVLSDAQDFVERLMQMTPRDAMAIHGKRWLCAACHHRLDSDGVCTKCGEVTQ